MKFKKLAIILLGFFSYQAKAEIILPRILGNGMVLQQQKPIIIWGTAAIGKKVNVSFANEQGSAIAAADGKWKVILSPLKASALGQNMIINGTNTIVLKDVLVGEVWLCSGQSNMEYAMRKNSKVDPKLGEGSSQNPVNELDFANNKNIRLFLVNRKELIKPDYLHAGWNTAEGTALRAFSAVAYFFAKKVNQDLNVPVGVISSAIPGSRIEPWINEADFVSSTNFKGEKIDGEPAKFYHPMIEPLIPFAIKGFLWYQGETNCFLKERLTYAQKMEVLINGWRKDWNDDQLPFYYVQIAPFLYTSSQGEVKYTPQDLPEFWEVQAAVSKVPHTAMAVITDLVDDVKGIHPPYKWEVGRRLALLALEKTYNEDIVSSGPVFGTMEINNKEIILYFKDAKGLKSKDGNPLNYFEIASADGNYYPAKAQIKGDKIIVSGKHIKQPKNVRFAWDEGAQANLFNSANLPAQPFRTDNQIINLFNPK